MGTSEKERNFSTKEEAFNFVFFIVFIATGFNVFANLEWFAPHDGRVFGAVMMSGLAWSKYLIDRVTTIDEPTRLPVWRYVLVGLVLTTPLIASAFFAISF